MKLFELTPAYGRDHKKKADVIAAFEDNKDFIGDHLLGFELINKADLTDSFGLPYTVNLRYNGNRSVAVHKVTQ